MMTPIGGVPVKAEFINKASPSVKNPLKLLNFFFLNKDTVDTSCNTILSYGSCRIHVRFFGE